MKKERTQGCRNVLVEIVIAMHSIDYFNHHGQADARKVAFILLTSVTELSVAAGVDLGELQGPQMMWMRRRTD